MGRSKDVLGIWDGPRREMEHGHMASGYIGLVFGRRHTGNCWDCHLVKNKDWIVGCMGSVMVNLDMCDLCHMIISCASQ